MPGEGKKFGRDQPVPKSPGRPKTNPLERTVQKLTAQYVHDLLDRLLTPALPKIFLSAIALAQKTGDMNQIQKLLELKIGRVKDPAIEADLAHRRAQELLSMDTNKKAEALERLAREIREGSREVIIAPGGEG